MKTKTVASSIVAAIVSCACLFMFVPTATAAEGVTVTSTKSFPLVHPGAQRSDD